MARLELPFVVCAPVVDEGRGEGESPEAYLERITAAKLEAVRVQWTGGGAGILVADTIVVSPRGRVLGKPESLAEAEAMIAELSYATHDVRTRFALGGFEPKSPALHLETVATRVKFRRVSERERADYVACGEGADKAGGYAIQGRAAAFIERIDGSYTCVVGLPLCEVVVAMREVGWL